MSEKQNQGFRFNREISVGDVAVILGAVGTIVMMWHNLDTRVTKLEAWREFARPAVATTAQPWADAHERKN